MSFLSQLILMPNMKTYIIISPPLHHIIRDISGETAWRAPQRITLTINYHYQLVEKEKQMLHRVTDSKNGGNEIERRIGSDRGIFAWHRKLLKSKITRVRFSDSLIGSKFSYGCQSWRQTRSDICKVAVVYNRFLRSTDKKLRIETIFLETCRRVLQNKKKKCSK